MRLAILAIAASMLCASPVEARSFGTHGGYVVSSRDGVDPDDHSSHCSMIKDFEGTGNSELLVVRYTDSADMVFVSITNGAWTINQGDEFSLVYTIDGYSYDREATGLVVDGRGGFFAGFPAEDFINAFSRGSGLRVYMGTTLVDSLSLSGSSVATTAFRQCFGSAVNDSKEALREYNRLSHIPANPFRR